MTLRAIPAVSALALLCLFAPAQADQQDPLQSLDDCGLIALAPDDLAPAMTAPPADPVAAIAKWEVLTTHGKTHDLAVAMAENYIESRAAGVTRLRLTFTGPIDRKTLTASALSIVGQAGGDMADLIGGLSLEEGDTVLVVDLLDKLPDKDRYTLALSDDVRSRSGTSLAGSKARHIGTLAGDVDASGTVSLADVMEIRSQLGKTLDSRNARCDLDCSGDISEADLILIQSLDGHALPSPEH